ncbi:MAG: 4-oxalocrotonate tautomerase [Streptomycetaceae bacterium]|jgi:4-oxalocrotonate tautomerase|nr:4-oxalocrotonate tautomerase [Streptomycetaceae bacterium]
MPIVRIEISEGQSYETKAKVAADVTEAIISHTGHDREKVLVFFYDIPRYEQAKGGVMRAAPPE